MYDFESWMKDNKNLVYHLIRKVDSKLITDEDLYQEICISIWKSLESFDDTKGICLNTYVSKSITNAIYYYLRKHHIDKDPYNHNIESIYKEVDLVDNSIQLIDMINSNNKFLGFSLVHLKVFVSQGFLFTTDRNFHVFLFVKFSVICLSIIFRTCIASYAFIFTLI